MPVFSNTISNIQKWNNRCMIKMSGNVGRRVMDKDSNLSDMSKKYNLVW